MVRRRFVDGEFGQIHVRLAESSNGDATPLACLHMSPKSGRLFEQFMSEMSADRMVIAHDYPGYGESDAPPSEPHVSVQDYARSLWDVADALELERLHLLGYHTGSLVAAEAARQQSDRVGAIVMISAPVFTPEELDDAKAYFEPVPLNTAGTRFQTMWERIVHFRGPGMTLESMAVSFAENLRGGEAYEWGHRAAFAYAPRFADVVAELDHRIVVLNLEDDLHEHTPRIAPSLRNGEIVDRPEWGHGFLDAYTADAVATVRAALNGRVA